MFAVKACGWLVPGRLGFVTFSLFLCFWARGFLFLRCTCSSLFSGSGGWVWTVCIPKSASNFTRRLLRAREGRGLVIRIPCNCTLDRRGDKAGEIVEQ